MSAHSLYETLRQFADSWGLAVMTLTFLTLALWPWRKGGKQAADRAATMIFEDEDDAHV